MISQYLKPEIGRICPHIEVVELIVRAVPCYGTSPELDGYPVFDEIKPEVGLTYEDRLQGRIVNCCRHRLSDIKYDLSYYDNADRFLGLNCSRFLEEDELDIKDHLPIDMKIKLPEGTVRCVFNVRGKKPGVFSRMFWG